jgi:5,10-methylenetetrahydromethanopterin reductase
VAIVGGEDTVAAQIGALAQAGVTDFVAGEFARGAEAVRTRTLLTSLAGSGVPGR